MAAAVESTSTSAQAIATKDERPEYVPADAEAILNWRDDRLYAPDKTARGDVIVGLELWFDRPTTCKIEMAYRSIRRIEMHCDVEKKKYVKLACMPEYQYLMISLVPQEGECATAAWFRLCCVPKDKSRVYIVKPMESN